MHLYEFEASLVYREISRTTRAATQRNPVSKNQNNNNKKKVISECKTVMQRNKDIFVLDGTNFTVFMLMKKIRERHS